MNPIHAPDIAATLAHLAATATDVPRCSRCHDAHEDRPYYLDGLATLCGPCYRAPAVAVSEPRRIVRAADVDAHVRATGLHVPAADVAAALGTHEDRVRALCRYNPRMLGVNPNGTVYSVAATRAFAAQGVL